ncbi:little elongation complex subunit 2 isoform X2 [Lampris incognitus]|uniref:little elongation complex subunit 2 isoform X2 n=1 Tax=Lampris incognitus TaxID=2546036 RepID=UPI0024B490CB|nr:little elongation complex subunit 2 isoform X2 [Lampris incognitus]
MEVELVWEDLPVPDTPFFTRDVYDKYSLAPNINELWAAAQSAAVNVDAMVTCGTGSAKPEDPPAAELKEDGFSRREACTSSDSSDPEDNAADGKGDCEGIRDSEIKGKSVKTEPGDAYPEPRVPFPCMSSLSSKEQKTYLDILTSKKHLAPTQTLKAQVNSEVMQFMKYLQDVSMWCADDYTHISEGAMRYSEEFFRGCLDYAKSFPQLYQIHETTSLTGGTFNPKLGLTFEKELLIKGDVSIIHQKVLPADAQLATDYQSVSSENPPIKKSKDKHATIATDRNAENLCGRYEPQVCLTRDALVRLLDNHGPEFCDPWELPVCVKLSPSKGGGSSTRKTVYIDSPLPKTLVTIRERSQIYHEESLKLSINSTGKINVSQLKTDVPFDEKQLQPENFQRDLVSFENAGLDFEMNLTDLETFGGTANVTPSKKTTETVRDRSAKNWKATASPPVAKNIRSSGMPVSKTTSSSSQEEVNASLTDTTEDSGQKDTTRTTFSESSVSQGSTLLSDSQLSQDSEQEWEKNDNSTKDSDDEMLIIDDPLSPAAETATQLSPETTLNSLDPPMIRSSDAVTGIPQSSSTHKITGPRRTSQRAMVSGDQLSKILRMQTAMLKPDKEPSKCSTTSLEPLSPPQPVKASGHAHPTSLVKPCVSSYLESNQNQHRETCSAALSGPASAVGFTSSEQKKLLSQDLQLCTEDEQGYEAPEEGNLIYKLYSLHDLLLLVRSSVSLTQATRVGKDIHQHVPVYILPKLEYQLCHGVECLSSSEACQLWTETQLHSSTVSYIAHINAQTSQLALLRKLHENWKENLIHEFKPSKSLNILHHLLKKISGLEEGRYLIGHKAREPFVTILKATDGKASRGLYNLQQIHSGVPQTPACGPVPWLPVDPSVVLPFHRKHNRVPCTFPPTDLLPKMGKGGRTWHKTRGIKAGHPWDNTNEGDKKKKKKKKKNKGKRLARREKWRKKMTPNP